MPFTRFRLPRRRPRLDLDWQHHRWAIYLPDPDDPLQVTGVGEASILATELTALPVRREALALLDEHRRLTALLLDPPPELGLFVGVAARCGVPGLDTPFCQTLLVEIEPDAAACTPGDSHREAQRAIRRAHMAQGLLLLDVLLTDGDVVRSVSCTFDGDPAWFDEVASGEPVES